MNDPDGSSTGISDPTLGGFIRGSETSRRRFLGLAAMAVGGAMIGVGTSGCGTAQTGRSSGSGSQAGRAGAAGDTLFVAGFQLGPPSSFNPLAPTPAFPTAVRQPQYIYETLVRFNMIDGSLAPGLGKELQEPDKQTIVVPLQDGTKWNDGSELTAEDVAFTFGLGKTSTGLWYSNVWQYVDSITATDPRTVTFKLKSKPYNPNLVKDYIANVMIMPKAVWSSIDSKNLVKETNLKPIGSGPFKLDKADQTQVNLIRDDNYWGKAVFGETPVKVMNHPIFKSNNDGDLKLESGEIDVSQQFTAQIWKMWENSKPGLDNVKVRQALAYAINYPNIATTAMSDYSEPANPSLIVPTGFESKYYDEAAVEAEGWSYNKEKAVQILEGELKAKKGSDGIYELPDGTKLGGWTLITPTGWTDWNTACEIVAKSATEIGIGIQTQFPQAPTMISRLQNGDFDLAMYSYTGVNAASPWVRFRDALDDRGVAKLGQTAYYNYNRFSNADVPALLDQAAAATDDATRKTAIQALDKIYRAEIPVIPLMYRPLEFYEFNESNWTNFPSEANSYAPPMWQGAGISWLFKIKKVGA